MKTIIGVLLCFALPTAFAGEAEYKACMKENASTFSMLAKTISMGRETLEIYSTLSTPPTKQEVEEVIELINGAKESEKRITARCEKLLGTRI